MGQKVNPHGIRVGVIKDWDSRGMKIIHIYETTRQAEISYAVFCLKKKKNPITIKKEWD